VTSLELSAKVAIFIFVVTSMLGVGLGLSLSQILESLRSTRLVFSSLAANVVLVPMLAYFIIRVIPLAQPLDIGIALLGTGAGAPFLPKLAEFARGNLAFAVGLMFLLMTVTIVYMPIVLPVLLPTAHVGVWAIARPLVTVMLMPLTVGLLLRARTEAFARFMQTYLRRASTIALVFVIISAAIALRPIMRKAL
jgi:predicted Na+-dependent transporter